MIDLSVNITTVANTSVIVRGYHVNTTISAHVTDINDGATTIFKIPAGLTAGTVVEFASDEGVIFEESLIVDPDDSATGDITILYKERAL
ncbi:hypothetical protein IH799_02015, partial [candidate division KSB1 bacterium]|nr:hypothetical protein [candidate division KSB1 bacterium]